MKTIIPYELTFYGLSDLGAKEFNLDSPGPFCAYSNAHVSKSFVDKIKSGILSRYDYSRYFIERKDNKLFDTITVKNGNFKLKILNSNAIRYYGQAIDIQIISEEIEQKTGRDIIISMEVSVFLEFLFKINTVVQYNFPGLYYLQDSNDTGPHKGLRLSIPILNDPNNRELQDAVTAGKAMLGKLTGKWIPGHIYLRRNGKKVLYLGDFKDFAYSSGYCEFDGSFLNKRLVNNVVSDSCKGFLEKSKLLIIIENSRIETILNAFKGTDVIDFLKNNLVDNRNLNFIFRDISSSSNNWTGQDLGEFIKFDPNINYNSIIKEMCKKELLSHENNPNNINLRHINFYPEIIKESDIIKNYIIDIKKESAISGILGSWYFRGGQNKDKQFTTDQLVSLVKSHNIYVPCLEKDIIFDTSNPLITISKEERTKLLDEITTRVNEKLRQAK